MVQYVDYEHELEIYNEDDDEYEYPVIIVTVAVWQERDFDGRKFTTGQVHDVEDGYELSKDDEEFIVDEVVVNHSWG